MTTFRTNREVRVREERLDGDGTLEGSGGAGGTIPEDTMVDEHRDATEERRLRERQEFDDVVPFTPPDEEDFFLGGGSNSRGFEQQDLTGTPPDARREAGGPGSRPADAAQTSSQGRASAEEGGERRKGLAGAADDVRADLDRLSQGKPPETAAGTVTIGGAVVTALQALL